MGPHGPHGGEWVLEALMRVASWNDLTLDGACLEIFPDGFCFRG